MDASIFSTKENNNSFVSLRFGMLFIGVGFGVLMGNILAVTTSLNEEVAYFLWFFSAEESQLVANYLIEKKEKKSKE